jgi:hypothetical protein
MKPRTSGLSIAAAIFLFSSAPALAGRNPRLVQPVACYVAWGNGSYYVRPFAVFDGARCRVRLPGRKGGVRRTGLVRVVPRGVKVLDFSP